jgi:RNA polymerase sigma-70 factor (ECF subfamily)
MERMIRERELFLLSRVYRQRDAQAYAELYEQHQPKIYRYLCCKLPRIQDAEDLTEETFLRAWRYATHTHVENFSPLVYKIAKNVRSEFYRQNQPHANEVTVEPQTLVAREEAQRGTGGDMRTNEEENVISLETIERHMGKLTDEQQDLIVLRYLNELPVREIARTLEKTENATRVQLHRALKALRALLDSSRQ